MIVLREFKVKIDEPTSNDFWRRIPLDPLFTPFFKDIVKVYFLYALKTSKYQGSSFFSVPNRLIVVY